MEQNFDVIIIGGGPGGYVTAIRAAQLGMKTAVVEREHMGGICLNWGCIPTKALLRSSEIHHLMHNLDAYGISAKDIKFDLAKVVARSRAVAGQLSKGVSGLMKKNKVTVFDGQGKLAGKGKVSVEKDGKKTELTAKHIILATGARARVIPGLEPDGKLIWTYREAMVPTEMPKSLLVVGSGAIGIEFASFYRSMGAEVTVVEVMDRILPVEDEEISKLAHKSFEKQGMKIMTSTNVKALKKNKDSVTVTLEKLPLPLGEGRGEGPSAQPSKGPHPNPLPGGEGIMEITVDRVIMAVGIVGNVENLGLEGTKVKVEKTHVVVDKWSATGEPGVYAIGDLTGPPWLAHKASHEGVICIEKIAGQKDVHPLDTKNIPGCTYSYPQVASVGMTEKAARDAKRDIKVGRFQFIGNGKAIALGEPEGLVKTIFDAKTGELLGAHMIGVEVTEMIQGYAIARQMEGTELDLMHTVFPHPTLSEMMHESVLDAFGKVIHM